MGNKKKHIHTDPTLSMIRDIFQENYESVGRGFESLPSHQVKSHD